MYHAIKASRETATPSVPFIFGRGCPIEMALLR